MSEKKGILLKAIAGFYYIEAGGRIYECKARGVFRKNRETLLVGDLLKFDALDEEKGIITEICERKNFLVRPPIANIDRLFIVSSHNTPSPNTLIIDRLTAVCINNNIEPVIVFNKSDLGDMTEYISLYKNSGFKTILASVKDGSGCEEIAALLKNKVSAFTGNSGVGKSSLLNAILPGLQLKTGEVSDKLGRGRHTTRHIELYSAFGGYVADTPGFSSLDIEKTMPLLKNELQFLFPEFKDYLGCCKFASCAHNTEKGCKVIEAVNKGKIQKSRFESYKTIYNEIKATKEWEMK